MIRRINHLKHVGRFAELRSQSGSQHEFTEVNVIYAGNACGKTTLCDVLRSVGSGNQDYLVGRKRFGSASDIEVEILLSGEPARKAVFTTQGWRVDPQGCSSPKILVYDDRFVADHVLIGHSIAVEHRRNLYGLALGDDARELQGAVATAESELAAANTELNAARTALSAFLPEGFTIESFRSLPKEENINALIETSTNELEEAHRAKLNADSIRQRKPLGQFDPPGIPADFTSSLTTTLEDAAVHAEAKIREHLQSHSKGLDPDWVGKGFRAQNGTICPHCGQEMGHLEILSAYRAFFSGSLQAHQETLARLKRDLEQHFGKLQQERLSRLLEEHIASQQWWREAGGFSFELPPGANTQIVISAMAAVHLASSNAIHRKLANPAQSTSLLQDEEKAFSDWTQIADQLAQYMAAIEPINTAISERQKLAGTIDIGTIQKRIVALDAQKKRHQLKVILAFSTFDAATRNKSEKERAKTAANRALREQSEAIWNEYGGRINALLQRFQVGFRLVSSGVNFRGGFAAGDLAVEILGTRVSTTPDDAKNPARASLANTLSGGDRSPLPWLSSLLSQKMSQT